MDSLNIVLRQLYEKANITAEIVKHDYISLTTQDGIKMSFKHNGKGLINASMLISKILNRSIHDINKQISRWMHTKNGVWAIDSLFMSKQQFPDSLYYSYDNKTIWKYKL